MQNMKFSFEINKVKWKYLAIFAQITECRTS